MKYKIKQNVRQHIIMFVFLLGLSLTAVYMLFNTNIPEKTVPTAVVPGIIILEKGRTVPFGQNEETLRLIESAVSFPNCADCMETAVVEVIQGNESRTLTYRFGGIAGFHDDTMEAFGYTFILRELLDESVTIEYEKVDIN